MMNLFTSQVWLLLFDISCSFLILSWMLYSYLLSPQFSNLWFMHADRMLMSVQGVILMGAYFFVSWDQSLIPIRMVEPMDYTPAPTDTLGHDVKIEVL